MSNDLFEQSILAEEYLLNRLVYVNSANHAYSELMLNTHMAMFGNNNVGKTASLAGMKLLLFPEVDFHRCESKFKFKGKEGVYSMEESYDFYFPDARSFIILEVNNPEGIFCMVLYKSNNYGYGRFFIPVSYDQMRTVFWDSETAQFADNISVSSLSQFTKKNAGQQLNDAKEITNLMFSSYRDVPARKRFCVLPLKDDRPNSIDAFRNIYQLAFETGSLKSNTLPNAIAALLEMGRSRDQERLDANLTELTEQHAELYQQGEWLQRISNTKPEYDAVKARYNVAAEGMCDYSGMYHSTQMALDLAKKKHTPTHQKISQDHRSKSAELQAIKSQLSNITKQVHANKGAADQISKQLAKKEGDSISIEPWDYRFYMEKVRKEKYDLDSEEVKQYLELNNLRKAIFYVAGELFNFNFEPVSTDSVPVFHPDVKVWEVTNKTNGEIVGLWYLDPYARAGKRSGAWATTYRSKSELMGDYPVLASNNSNFVKPAEGEPTLVSWDDAETFFHEFGHALHFLSADIKYPTLNGGVRDYTEFQSQLLERWLSTDAVINKFLKHYETGEPMPAQLVEKIKKASTFNQGFATTEFLASALMDMIYHTTDPNEIKDIQEFEKSKLQELGMPSEIPMRHRSTQFGHVFSGEGYATGYYGYLWADVLTSDAAEAFAEAPDGFYDKEVANKLVKFLFAPRNAEDPAEAYKKFRGRDATIDALMRDRGFPVPQK